MNNASSTTASMHVDYEITIEDVAAFSVYHFRTSSSIKRRLRFTQGVGVFSTLVLANVWPVWSLVERLIFAILLSLMWILAYPQYYRWAVRRHASKTYSASKSKGVIGKHTVIITASSLTERSSIGESTSTWAGIERIADDNQYVYIFTGPFIAHVIPKRAFKTTEEAERFLATAKAFFTQQRRENS